MTRDTYHEQLDQVLTELERMTQTVSLAVRRTEAGLRRLPDRALVPVVRHRPDRSRAGGQAGRGTR